MVEVRRDVTRVLVGSMTLVAPEVWRVGAWKSIGRLCRLAGQRLSGATLDRSGNPSGRRLEVYTDPHLKPACRIVQRDRLGIACLAIGHGRTERDQPLGSRRSGVRISVPKLGAISQAQARWTDDRVAARLEAVLRRIGESRKSQTAKRHRPVICPGYTLP